MILRSLSVINYKNIREASLKLSPKMNCFTGLNGEGKTNLLDAIHYLSFCRSFSNPADSQIINHDADFFVLEGEYANDAGLEQLSIYCGMKRGQRKHFKRDKKEYRKLSEHIGLIPAVLVSPADTLLIGGHSEERRRLMDMAIAQYDRNYMEALSTYGRALQQRNSLLKAESQPEPTLMDILEEEMARSGEQIYACRNAFIEELTPIFQTIYSRIADSREQVSLNYVSHAQRGPLLDVIRRDRHKDFIMGHSLHGIHRDDLELLLGGYQLRREGSQGQHKSFVIALKLAQFDFLRRTPSATTPLLLLDDIFDKLDSRRVEQIVRLVADDTYGQIFITDTHHEHIRQILSNQASEYKTFQVESGQIREL